MDEKCDAPWGVKAKAYNLIEKLLGLDACNIDIVDLKNADYVVKESIKEGYIILKGNKDAVFFLYEIGLIDNTRYQA